MNISQHSDTYLYTSSFTIVKNDLDKDYVSLAPVDVDSDSTSLVYITKKYLLLESATLIGIVT